MKLIPPVPPSIVKVCAPSRVLLKEIFALLESMVLLPIKLTGFEKVRGFAPVTVILFAILIWLALVNVRLVKGATSPTEPEKVIRPLEPAIRAKEVAPLRVDEKTMLAPVGEAEPFVLSKIKEFVRATGPEKLIIPPLVVILPCTLIALVAT